MSTISRALFSALIFSSVVMGQATDSIIAGSVKDPSGAAVVGVTITAVNKQTNVKYTSVTNAAGDYRLNNVPVGLYDVSATAPGFATETVANVKTDLNHTITTNITLQVSAVTSTVQVIESAAAIDTSTAQVQTTFDSKQAVDLPVAGISKVVNGAGIYNLSLLGAGVSSQGGIGQGTGPSIAGQRPENNSFNIDGVSNNSGYNTGPEVYVSNEAVSELNIQQNQFNPEFGGASGGVFNVVVKTGTNQLHGSIYEYLQNRDLNAVDYSTVIGSGQRTNTRFDNNRLGATVGGPIKKNKLFYFGNFEYNPLGQSSNPGQPVDAPTAGGLQILNGMPGVSKTNLGVFEKYVPVAAATDPSNPVTVVNGVNIPIGLLTFASPNYNNAYHAIAAIDYNISDKDQLRGRYIYDKSVGIDFNASLPVFYEPSPATNNMVAVSEFHNFSPTLENELRLSYRRNNANISAGNFSFPGLDAFPNISLDDLGLQIGPDPNTPSGAISNTASLVDNLSKTWGKHSFKLGYSITDIILTGTFVQRARGDYDYSSLGEFLLDQQPSGSLFGTPSSGERSVGAANGVPFGFLQHAAYFNDDWKIRPNLTLNLGIRYEYVTVPVGSRAQQYSSIADVPGVISFAAPQSTKNDWSPRIGFAYSPGHDGKWSIRGGVARSFDNTYINLNQNSSPLYYQTTVDVNDANPVSNFLAHGGISGALPPQATTAQARAAIGSYTWDQHRPYALVGSIGVQRLIGKDYTIEARYMYTKGVHLWNQTRTNVVAQVTPTNYIPTYFTMPTAAQLAGDKLTLGALSAKLPPGTTVDEPWNALAVYGFQNALVGYNPWGNSRYNGLAIQMTKRYSKNFSFIFAYTWSHNFDDSTATNNSTILSPRRSQDFQDQRSEWASSALDRRHRLTLTPVYDFRPFQGGNWIMKNLVGNWNLSGTYTFESPEYVTIQDGIDANLNNDPTGDRAIINPAGAAKVGSDVTGLNSAGQAVDAGSDSIVAYVANNPNARYVVAGFGALANGGRNTFPLGRTNNIDMALMKRISVTERTSVSFGAQFFNLLNHSQFTGSYLSDVSPYATNGISRSFLVPSEATFGQYNNFFPSNSRQVQIVARIVF
ncbi:MAG TPA: carboxypeptidase regulatory-like domain-containing protein [Bryobacteraceae bacterium]|nr:carboxypeptidase regulatory-like domain-containing protein [Bryobacteraceae bacterium]